MKKIFLLILVFLMIFSSTLTAYAADKPISSVEAFGDLTGDAKYINNSDNYYFDLMDLGILDTGVGLINNAANAIFLFEKWLVHITCVAFYYVTSADFGEFLASPIDDVQNALKTKMFDPMFTLMFVLAGFWIAVMMAKRNLQEILNQTMKVIFIVICASVLAQKSSSVVSMVDNVTNSVSNAVMSAMSLQGVGGTNYGATTAGNLWVDLIHTPWKSMEFGTSQINDEEQEIGRLLGAPPLSTERDDIVEDLVGDKKDPKVFGLDMPLFRLALVIAHLLPLTATCIVYLLIALLQLAFRLLTIFLMFIGTFVLLLSIVPFLGGLNLFKKWALKVAEMQIMILSLAFLLGFMTLINTILVSLIGSHGWLISHYVRVGIDIAIFVFRGKIFGIFATMQKTVHQTMQNPKLAGYQMQWALAERAEKMGNVGTAIQSAPQAIHNSLDAIKELSRIGENKRQSYIGGGFEPNLKVNDPITPEMYYEYSPYGNLPPMLQQTENVKNRPLLVSANDSDEKAYRGNIGVNALPMAKNETNIEFGARPLLQSGFIEKDNRSNEPTNAETFQEAKQQQELNSQQAKTIQIGADKKVLASELINPDDEMEPTRIQVKRPILSPEPEAAQQPEGKGYKTVPFDSGSNISKEMESKPTLIIDSEATGLSSTTSKQERPTLIMESEATDLSSTTSKQERPTLKHESEAKETPSHDNRKQQTIVAMPDIDGDTSNMGSKYNATTKPQKAAQKAETAKPIKTLNNSFEEHTGPPMAVATASLELGEETPREYTTVKRNKRQRPTLEKPQENAIKKTKTIISEQSTGNEKSEITPTVLMQAVK